MKKIELLVNYRKYTYSTEETALRFEFSLKNAKLTVFSAKLIMNSKVSNAHHSVGNT